jgi:pseudouridine-5'-phosphate glycosidase
MFYNRFRFSKKVQDALKMGKPVVALESTIITHGMPYPDNLKTALEVEEMVRIHGSTPATIALINGYVKIGLEIDDMELLAKTGVNALKTSRRDMALAISQRLVGATTVSATMIAAHYAGIKVFVTGGIGGVHRGGETSFDISADLMELGRTPVAVVCAGVKSILDIEKTLEYLETQGVTTVTFGKTKEFPSFYTRSSGFNSMTNLNSVKDCAEIIQANVDLNLQSGMVIAVPIPEEYEYPDHRELERTIESALKESEKLGIKGKDSTPFLLGKVKELTKGQSLTASLNFSCRYRISKKQCSNRESNCCCIVYKRKESREKTSYHWWNSC